MNEVITDDERWRWTPQKNKFIEDTASVCASLTKRVLDLEKLNKQMFADLLDCIEKLQMQMDEMKAEVEELRLHKQEQIVLKGIEENCNKEINDGVTKRQIKIRRNDD